MSSSSPGPLTYRTGDDASRGGLDITISLSPEEAAALGTEATTLADWFDTALWALAMLRTGTNTRRPDDPEPTPDDWYWAITDLDARLLPRLRGLVDASIRAHQSAGGSLATLALAMDAPRSTAQSRRNKVLGQVPASSWELWARNGGPDRPTCPACGNKATTADPLVPTAEDYPVHRSHTTDPKSGFYRTALADDDT